MCFNSDSDIYRSSLVAQMVKNLPAMQKTQVWTLGWEDPLEKGMATQPSILVWRISWTGEPCGLQSMGHKESDATERLTLPLSLAFVSLTTSVKLFHLWILESFSIEMTTFRLGSVPGLGRSPGEGKGCPLQYCGLQNSMDCIVHGIAKNWTRLSNFHSLTHTVVRSKVKYNMRNLVECLPCGRKPTNSAMVKAFSPNSQSLAWFLPSWLPFFPDRYQGFEKLIYLFGHATPGCEIF